MSIHRQLLKGKIIEFHEDMHDYFVDGIKVPSITQIIKAVLPNPYTNVEPSVLMVAASRGQALHQEIEDFETKGIYGRTIEFSNYLRIKQKHRIEVVENELFIYIEIDGKIFCAGRLDMVIKHKDLDGLGISDIKRTSQIHAEHLRLQLNLYRIGYMQCYQKPIDFLTCIHLRNSISNFIYVPIDESDAFSKLRLYLNQI
jgi:hypothetical protein